MLSCDPPTLLSLRRSTRLFLRLFGSPDFRPLWTSPPPPLGMKLIPSVWPSPRVGLLSPSQTSTLRALLARDAASSPYLCSDCRAQRQRSDWPARLERVTSRRLFCGGGCRAWHPTSCFSPAQRAASPSVRVCIGREGHVRLCRHVTLSWTTVAALVPLARSRQPHESDWEGPSQALMVAECRHPSHLPGPQHRMTGQFRSSQYRFPSAWLDPTRRCPATGPSPPVALHLHYVAHTRMSRPDAGGGRFTPNVVAQRLSLLRQDVGRYIAPQVTPGVLPEMLALGVNSCTCLKHPGTEYSPPGWRLSGVSYPSQETPWVSHYSDKPECRGRLPAHHCSAFHVEQTDLGETRRTLPFPHTCTAVLPCYVDSKCTAVSYTCRIRVTHDSTTRSDVTPDWQQAVEPESYLPVSAPDDDTQGILSCPNTSCINHHRFAKPLRVWQ